MEPEVPAVAACATADLPDPFTRVNGWELSAAGSASEAEYQLLLARDLGYFPAETHLTLDAQANEVKKMLNSFMQKLR